MVARILFSSLCRPASRDANAIQIDRMCSAFARYGHQVTLTAIGSGPMRERGYDLVVLPWPFFRFRSRLMQAMTAYLLLSSERDILLTRSPLLAQAGLWQGISVVVELHSLPVGGSKTQHALRSIMQHPKLRRIVSISQLLADDLLSNYGLPHPGCDIVIAHDGAEAGLRPGPLAAHAGPPQVGYFGHLYPGKGIETVAALAPLLPEMCFVVYGGTEEDIAQWKEACAGQDNLTLHGHIHHTEVATKMAACDILIAPYAAQVSHVGGGEIGRWMSPLKLFEYMAAERPIVTSDLQVLREVVRNDETALLCPPGDVQAFAAALRRLAANPILCARLGSAGRDLLETEYTWEMRARRVLDGIVAVNDG